MESKNSDYYKVYVTEGNEIRKLTRQLQKQFEKDIAAKVKENPKAF